METPSDEELKLREARVQGAEHGVQALKQATLDLERRAAQFDIDVHRLEDKQASTLKWTVGSILALGAILASVGIALLMYQADARRDLDARLASEISSLRAQADQIERTVTALDLNARSTEEAASRSLETTEALVGAIGEVRQGLERTNHRTDLMLGRLSENIDNIRADFAYLVEGGGHRSSFAGQIFIDVPYESADVDRAGTFISDIELSLLSSGGQLRAGTLRLTVPRHGLIPRQRVTYSLNMHFLTALADLVGGTDAGRLLRVANVDSLLNSFYELEAWPVLVQATLDGELTDFLIDAQEISTE